VLQDTLLTTRILRWLLHSDGLDSIFSIATGYGVEGLVIKFWWGARISAPVQTGPGAHPASCKMGTGSFQG